MTVVVYERGPADIGFISRYRAVLERLEDEYRAGRTRADGSRAAPTRARVRRARGAAFACASEPLAASRGPAAGSEGSIDKLLMTRAEQSLHHAALDVLESAPLFDGGHEWLYDYLYSRGQSIYGGTEQIQKGIVAQRLLGLAKS